MKSLLLNMIFSGLLQDKIRLNLLKKLCLCTRRISQLFSSTARHKDIMESIIGRNVNGQQGVKLLVKTGE